MNNADNPSDVFGKKIFFLHPTAIVENKIVDELIQQEYEVYIVKNQDSLRRVLKKYPDSIVFADINEGLSEKEWETWITTVMEAPETKNVAIGIVTAKDDEALKEKYLTALKIPCGYTGLKSDLDAATTHILEILHQVDAKGQRKYLRATTENESNATVNLPINGLFINGVIKDVSVVGISCTFDEDPELVKNALFKDIQVKLQSNILKVEGIVFGSRKDEYAKTYVILFTQRIDPDVRMRIRKYIQHDLQSKMDSLLG